MRRFFIVFASTIFSLFVNAQIFNTIKYLDKFDDVIQAEQRKTLIEKTDSTFIIEEKGKKPTVYHILNIVDAGTSGSKENIVELVDNVYGYETSWCVVKDDMMDDYSKAYLNYYLDPSKENMDILMSFWIFAVNRIVTSQYTKTFISEHFWLSDESNNDKLGKNINRIVYSR